MIILLPSEGLARNRVFLKKPPYFTFRGPENISKILQEEWNVARCEWLASRTGRPHGQDFFDSIHLSRRCGRAGCKLGGFLHARRVPSQSGNPAWGSRPTAFPRQGRPAPAAGNGTRMLLDAMAELRPGLSIRFAAVSRRHPHRTDCEYGKDGVAGRRRQQAVIARDKKRRASHALS